MTHKQQGGFTLIELMIVVAIIGILAAVALPQYQDYVARGQVAEASSLSTSARTAIAEFHQSTGAYPTANSNPSLNNLGATGTYSELTVAAGGVITVTMKATGVATDVQNKVITFRPDITNNAFKWSCSTDMDLALAPKGCVTATTP